jgi:hypothetical protein
MISDHSKRRSLDKEEQPSKEEKTELPKSTALTFALWRSLLMLAAICGKREDCPFHACRVKLQSKIEHHFASKPQRNQSSSSLCAIRRFLDEPPHEQGPAILKESSDRCSYIKTCIKGLKGKLSLGKTSESGQSIEIEEISKLEDNEGRKQETQVTEKWSDNMEHEPKKNEG